MEREEEYVNSANAPAFKPLPIILTCIRARSACG